MLGRVGDAVSPATTYSPIVGADLEVTAGASGDVPVDASFEHAVLALSDDLVVDGEPLAKGSLLYLGCGRESVAVGSDGGPARGLLLGGEPFDEELLMWWNFVGRDHDEVEAVARGVAARGRRGGHQVRSGHRLRRGGASGTRHAGDKAASRRRS